MGSDMKKQKRITETGLLRLLRKHKKLKLSISRNYQDDIDRVRILEEGKFIKYHFGWIGDRYYQSCYDGGYVKPNSVQSVRKMFKYDARIRRHIHKILHKNKTIWSAT